MKVKKGDRIKLEYKGKLENGITFDESRAGQPLEFTVGEGKIIPGIERAVEGMDVGEQKSVTVRPEEAYGQRDEELVRKLERGALPAGFSPEVGMIVTLDLQNGDTVAATIVDVTDRDVVLDLNHPLAGQNLSFDIKVTGIETPTTVV